jgi:hypothetical protein
MICSSNRPNSSLRDLFTGVGDTIQWRKTLNQLRETGPDLPSDAATLIRLFRSRHVSDLKLIAGISVWLLVGAIIVISSKIDFSNSFGKNIEAIGTPVITIFGVIGVVMGWVYRTASARLGIVDLFAYEITTLCRVGTTVDSARRYIAAFENNRSTNITGALRGRPTLTSSKIEDYVPYRFVSAENYFPVFDGNSRDLRVLEAGVVTNVTAFYTYMKVVRDYLRRIGDLDPRKKSDVLRSELQNAWVNVIYMLFLAYETARKSINDLIEYEPTHVESTIIILITEIAAFGFLKKYFAGDEDDIRFRRLKLRVQEYNRIVGGVFDKVSNHPPGTVVDEKEWAKAAELLPELGRRCREAGLLPIAPQQDDPPQAEVVVAFVTCETDENLYYAEGAEGSASLNSFGSRSGGH